MSIKDYFGNLKTLLVKVHDAELKAASEVNLLSFTSGGHIRKAPAVVKRGD